MYRFLLSRRWIGFGLAVVLLAAVCVWLGSWQFERQEDRREVNEAVRANLSGEPVPLNSVSNPNADLSTMDEWQPVQVAGTYDVSREIVLRHQARGNHPGVEIVTPLITDSGEVVLINRGWMPGTNTTERVTDIPQPPAGRVEVTGWLRLNSTATGQPVEPVDAQVRAISTTGLTEWIEEPLYPGYIDLVEQTPEPDESLASRPQPDLGGGPHFFYGLQWVFFGLLAVFGFGYFAWLEVKDRRKELAT